jgi:uncharacterized damage-inducible protein DinB
MVTFIESCRAEFMRYKALAEAAMAQLDDAELCQPGPKGGSSIATIVWHVSGNLRSRFTDFLTADGEKPWRHREEEFEPRLVRRDEVLARWDGGWEVLLQTLDGLTDAHLSELVTIRGTSLTVLEALHRSLAHLSYHVGQIVYLAKSTRGRDWQYLSIPPGGWDSASRESDRQDAAGHAAQLSEWARSRQTPGSPPSPPS